MLPISLRTALAGMCLFIALLFVGKEFMIALVPNTDNRYLAHKRLVTQSERYWRLALAAMVSACADLILVMHFGLHGTLSRLAAYRMAPWHGVAGWGATILVLLLAITPVLALLAARHVYHHPVTEPTALRMQNPYRRDQAS